MDPRQLAQGVGAARVVFGLAFLAAPGPTGRAWIGRDADRAPVKLLTQAVGARDLTMGIGTLAALRARRGARTALVCVALTDALDFTCALAAGDRMPRGPRAVVLALAGAAAVQGAIAAAGTTD